MPKKMEAEVLFLDPNDVGPGSARSLHAASTDFAEARRNLDANARSSSFSPPTRCSPARKITVALRRR